MTQRSKNTVFEQSVAAYIARHALLAPGARVIVALSGGADSVALLTTLVRLGYGCVAAHCNFHLRGDESTRDMRHAVAVANRLGVDISVKHFDTEAYARRTGLSIEMAARELRYAWFTELLEREQASAIAVAHHREDQVETFMLNLLRITGLTGLTGMSPCSGLVVRPLLDMSRADIEGYLATMEMEYVFDSSNDDNTIRRNRLRNVVIPVFEGAFPEVTRSILSTISNLRSNLALYEYAVRTLGASFVHDGGTTVDIAAMRAALPGDVARTLLFEILRPCGFNATHADNILSADGSATFSAGAYHAVLSRGILSVSHVDASIMSPTEYSVLLTRPVTEPVRLDVSRHNIAEFAPERDASTVYFDERILHPRRKGDHEPHFTLRHWRRGDRMKPFGMTGSKLVSDIFADARYSEAQKREAWLLTRDGVIIWVVGLRASSAYAVTPRTRTYLRISLRDYGV